LQWFGQRFAFALRDGRLAAQNVGRKSNPRRLRWRIHRPPQYERIGAIESNAGGVLEIFSGGIDNREIKAWLQKL
jgi:hypothetical protein